MFAWFLLMAPLPASNITWGVLLPHQLQHNVIEASSNGTLHLSKQPCRGMSITRLHCCCIAVVTSSSAPLILNVKFNLFFQLLFFLFLTSWDNRFPLIKVYLTLPFFFKDLFQHSALKQAQSCLLMQQLVFLWTWFIQDGNTGARNLTATDVTIKCLWIMNLKKHTMLKIKGPFNRTRIYTSDIDIDSRLKKKILLD